MTGPQITTEARQQFEEGVRLSQHPGTVEASAAAFERAIQLCPDYEEAYFEQGTMYYRWSHFQKAIEPLKKAIELAPEQPAAYGNLGMNYNLAARYHDAEDVLRRVLNIVPDHIAGNYRWDLRSCNRDEQRKQFNTSGGRSSFTLSTGKRISS